MLDKSQGNTLGPELVTNGNFSGGSTGWALGIGWSVSGGAASFSGATAANLTQLGILTVGKTYKIELDVTVSAVYVAFLTNTFTQQFTMNSSQHYTVYLTASGVNLNLYAAANAVATIDNISVKELPGNHATQATLAQRPTYGINPITGTRNLLTYTEQFGNAAWTKTRATITADAVAAPDGSITADKLVEDTTAANSHQCFRSFTTVNATTYSVSCYVKAAGRTEVSVQLSSGAGAFAANAVVIVNLTNGSIVSGSGTVSDAGNGWYRISVVNTSIAVQPADLILRPAVSGNVNYNGDGVSGVYLWGAQLEVSSTATAYQKVVTQYEVTEAGVASASYLSFDGVDDGMVTGTITPAIDKVQVFVGLRKLSDAGIGIFIESSSGIGGNNGCIQISAPGTGATSNYTFQSKGTVSGAASYTNASVAAPVTNVVSGIGEIAADISILRVNGSQVATSATDQGTGNYLAYPLYIGRRGGTTLPYNGRIYSMITRFGSNLTTGQITSTESWVNSKTGAY
jgi:hypothetical protein